MECLGCQCQCKKNYNDTLFGNPKRHYKSYDIGPCGIYNYEIDDEKLSEDFEEFEKILLNFEKCVGAYEIKVSNNKIVINTEKDGCRFPKTIQEEECPNEN